MATTLVDGGWRRRSLARQVDEALTTHWYKDKPLPKAGARWLIAGRMWTATQLADRLLDGGSAGATGRDTTIIAPRAQTAGSLYAALGLCVTCPPLCPPDATHLVAIVSRETGIETCRQVCARCADRRYRHNPDAVIVEIPGS